MKYYKSILTIAGMLLFVVIANAQDEPKKDKKQKKKDKIEANAETTEVTEKVMEPKVVEFQEPAFAMEIEQGSKANSDGIFNAYSMEILNADKKIVEKAWKALMKSYRGKTKFNRKEAEMGTLNAKVTELGSALYNVKASIEQRGGNVVVHSWFEGTEGYVDGNADSANAGVNDLLNAFAVNVRKDMVKVSLGNEEKVLKQSENELSKLKRQNDTYHKVIETAKRKIAEAEQNIIENEAAQEIAITKIDGQRSIVESVRQRLKRIN